MFPQLSNIDSRIWNSIQDKTGKNLRASQTMPWVRVTSTMGNWLSMESCAEKGESFAQKYGNTKRSGRLGITNDADGNKDIYGKESTDRALRPSPVINSISVTQGTEGLSKKTSFTIICYSLGQADVVMKYFLEPGNMVLVEWGENTRKSVAQKVKLDACSVAVLAGHKVLQKKRMDAGDMAMHTNEYRPDDGATPMNGGQYDAVLGYITGGGMKYGDNESYEIQVELSSVGELPAYLQHHKDVSGKDVKDSALTFQEGELEKEHPKFPKGHKLFMQMFNDLPSNKRHKEVKKLQNQDWALDASNFINFDKTMRENLLEQISEGSKLSGMGKNDQGDDIEIMTDMPLFSDKRFLKVSLAFTILDTQSAAFQANSLGNCSVKPASMNISWKNTILRAHKNIFSADSEYLHIPNKYSPDWDLKKVLTTTEGVVEILPPKERFGDPDKNGRLTLDTNEPGIAIDTHPHGESADDPKLNYFPRHDNCLFFDQQFHDKCVEPTEFDAYEWGFLRDLYINFDFFCDVMKKTGLVTKDVYYDLLNGISSAVNLNWEFQIIQTKWKVPIYHPDYNSTEDKFVKYIQSTETDLKPQTTGDNELQIVCLASTGDPTKLVSKGIGLAKFKSRGSETPFLSCDFTMDIPGAMKGMIVAKGQSGTSSPNMNPEAKEQHDESSEKSEGLFSNEADSVKLILNPVTIAKSKEQAEADKKAEEERIEAEKGWIEKTTDSASSKWSAFAQFVGIEDTEEEIALAAQAKSNIEFFLKNVLVVPAIQGLAEGESDDIVKNWHDWGSSSTVDINSFILAGGWNDSSLLKRIQRYNTQKYVKEGGKVVVSGGGQDSKTNVPLLPIKFNFTIHGVSGLQVGNTFSIPDLPGKSYSKKIFQITSIEHSISQDLWTTSVEGSMRNLDVGSGAIKKFNDR
jgi:hypothetical protein